MAFFRVVPNLTIMAPANFKELEDMLEFAVNLGKPVIIRYPRGGEENSNIRKEKIDTPVIILTANVKKVQKHLQKTWKIEKRTFIRLKSLITKVLLFNAFKKLEKNNTKFYITAFSF